MDHNKFKIFILVLIIILIILIFLVSLATSRKNLGQNKITIITPSPTIRSIKSPIKITSPEKSQSINITPKFTGVDENIDQSVIDVSTQKQNLKKSLPLNKKEFSITYDYSADFFIIALSEPKTENKNIFVNWLKENYPLIPLNKFIFK